MVSEPTDIVTLHTEIVAVQVVWAAHLYKEGPCAPTLEFLTKFPSGIRFFL
jgi:hypothetical protein